MSVVFWYLKPGRDLLGRLALRASLTRLAGVSEQVVDPAEKHDAPNLTTEGGQTAAGVVAEGSVREVQPHKDVLHPVPANLVCV